MNQQNFHQNTYYAALPTSTLAIVSLVAGILSFFALPILGGIVALWAGYAARKETRSVPPGASGDGMATAGILIGWIHMVLLAMGLCVGLAIFLFSLLGIGSFLIWNG